MPKSSCKSDFRQASIAKRDNIDAELRATWSHEACERLTSLDEFQTAAAIHVFVPFGSEIDTRPLIEQAWKEGKTVVVPRTDVAHQRLEHCIINGWQDLVPGYASIPEPRENTERFGVSELDLVVTPGCAFDPYGARMGYGGGYYDRFLYLTTASRVAIAFDIQIIDQVPYCAHDLLVHKVVTEKRVLICDATGQPPCFLMREHPETCPYSGDNRK